MDRNKFYAALSSNNLEQYTPQFDALMKDSIRYTLTPLEAGVAPVIGSSRMGGTPDLPAGIEWPIDNNGYSPAFIAQLNLKEMKPFDTYHLLPDSGILFFFYDAEQTMGGYSLEEKHLFKVIYFDGNSDALTPTPFPEDIPDFGQFNACQLTFSTEISMPYRWGKNFSFLNSEERDIYGGKVYPESQVNKTFGHADILQSEMEEMCEAVMSPEINGDFKKLDLPEFAAQKEAAKDWILLMQVDSNERTTRMRWSDMGRLYFWIKKHDLEQRNFENVWCILQDM